MEEGGFNKILKRTFIFTIYVLRFVFKSSWTGFKKQAKKKQDILKLFSWENI